MSNEVTFQVRDLRERFYQIDNRILEGGYAKAVGVYGLAVYNVLAFYAHGKQTVWPSYQTIADTLGISRRRVITSIDDLEQLNIIRRQERYNEKTGAQTSNYLHLLDKSEWKKVEDMHVVHPPSAQDAPEENNLNKTIIKKTKDSSSFEEKKKKNNNFDSNFSSVKEKLFQEAVNGYLDLGLDAWPSKAICQRFREKVDGRLSQAELEQGIEQAVISCEARAQERGKPVTVYDVVRYLSGYSPPDPATSAGDGGSAEATETYSTILGIIRGRYCLNDDYVEACARNLMYKHPDWDCNKIAEAAIANGKAVNSKTPGNGNQPGHTLDDEPSVDIYTGEIVPPKNMADVRARGDWLSQKFKEKARIPVIK